MSGIAEVLLTLGYRVSGSDLAASETTRRLERWAPASTRARTTPRTSTRRST